MGVRWSTRTLITVAVSFVDIEREFDLPPAIVWDALIDPVLLEGWLANAVVEPRVGGQYRLDWIEPRNLRPLVGVITELAPTVSLEVHAAAGESVRFELRALKSGTRELSTALRVVLASAVDPRFARAVVAHWQSNLEQLESLLRGHPVDWSTWQQDRGQDWASRVQRAGPRLQ